MKKSTWIIIGVVVLILIIIAVIYKRNKPLLDKFKSTPPERKLAHNTNTTTTSGSPNVGAGVGNP